MRGFYFPPSRTDRARLRRCSASRVRQFRWDIADQRVSFPQWTPILVCRSRQRYGRSGSIGQVPSHGGRGSRGQSAGAKLFFAIRRTGQVADCLGFNERHRPARNARRDHRGRRAVRALVGGIRRVRGARTLVVETNAPGGQAGSSSKIENYLGFPTGISGQELAGRAYTQGAKIRRGNDDRAASREAKLRTQALCD